MRRASRLSRTIAITAVLVLSGIGATVVTAQGPPALGSILATLEQILSSITGVEQGITGVQQGIAGVQESVNGVQQSVTALGATSNFAFTSAVIVESGIIDCGHINVSSVDRHVTTQLINANTGAVLIEGGGTIATPPGRFRGVGAFSPGGFSGTAYCKFTVLDGTKADIRGALTLTPNAGGNETTSVSVDAR
jgi:hypothetical protein